MKDEIEITWKATPDKSKETTRKRYTELIIIANKLCTWLEKNGVKTGELCELKDITENLWYLPKK